MSEAPETLITHPDTPGTNKCFSILHSSRPCYWIERQNLIQCPYKNPWNSWLFSLLCGCCLPAEAAATGLFAHRRWAASPSPHGSRAQPSPTQQWAQGTAPAEDASLPPSSLCYVPAASRLSQCWGFEQFIFSRTRNVLCHSSSHSCTQAQLLLRGRRHTLLQLHCAGPRTSAEISQRPVRCLLGKCWYQQQLLASSYATAQLWSFPLWQNCFTTKDPEWRCMEDKSQAARAIRDLFMSH